MTYKIVSEYGCAYRLNKSGELEWCPMYSNGTFNFELEGGVVERPHDDVPEEFFNQVIADLRGF